MTIAVSIFGQDGTVLAADTQEVIPNALKSHGEKIHIIGDTPEYKAAMAAAGDVDFILMAKDFIREKIEMTPATDREIMAAIRSAIQEMWSDFVQYGQDTTNISLLVATFSSDKKRRLTVVSNNAVRSGRFVEAVGIGDATFLSLADHYLGKLNRVTWLVEAFVIFAMQQVKNSVPGCGGSTRILTIMNDGSMDWKNPYEIHAIQDFFFSLNMDISSLILTANVDSVSEQEAKEFIEGVTSDLLKEREKLVKEIERIRKEHPPWLVPSSF
jgi:20S proteasome alpha/beta subunit